MKPIVLAAGVAVTGAALFLGGALAPLRVEDSIAQPRPAAIRAGTGAAVRALEARAAANPSDAAVHAQLGLAYLQEARDEADPSSLPPAERALRRSLELQPPDNGDALTGMAALANARHDFTGSVAWSRRAIAANPYGASAYGLLGDALFELGRVRAADAAYQKMVDVRPDVASYVRASYALQHQGRMRAAIGVLKLALEAAGPSGQTTAWVRHQIGDVYAGLGDYREAARQNRIGIAIAPGYVPPTVGLAESYIAAGRLEDAVQILEVAARELPSLEYLTTLGDLYALTGRADRAETQYAAVAEKLREHRRNGVAPDADFVVFYADHGLRPRAALREAFDIYRNRPTPKTADALAWMLHSTGRDAEAWRYARTAVNARPADAGALLHSATIARGIGSEDLARRLVKRALRIDPTLALLQPSLVQGDAT